MQLMTWTLARLGSRFNLLFEPYHRRIRHSSLGRFAEAPLDLMVGLVEPDGTQRVLPLSSRGQLLFNCEQFARMNSITFRGFSEKYRLRFEFNIHSVFYPQNEELCTMPAFYLEMRVNPVDQIRDFPSTLPTPEKVKLFIRLQRPDTHIRALAGPHGDQSHIDLTYRNSLQTQSQTACFDESANATPASSPSRIVNVHERIVSLNPHAQPDEDAQGLTLEIPVTEEGSGIKWRLVWGAYCGDPILQKTNTQDQAIDGQFRYTRHWHDINKVISNAIAQRDERLALSRRFEKMFDQTPLQAAQRHLFYHSFQNYLSNTFWCHFSDGQEWFSVWAGNQQTHSPVSIEYTTSPFYLCLWPRLLALELEQWATTEQPHAPSTGSVLAPDLGHGFQLTPTSKSSILPAQINADYLLLLQSYCHVTGDLTPARQIVDLIERLAQYLLWTDRESCGFVCNTTSSSASNDPASTVGRKQTRLAVKRIMALAAAADLLGRLDRPQSASRFAAVVSKDSAKIEKNAWHGDHFVLCTDGSVEGVLDGWSEQPIQIAQTTGWDAYSIDTSNALVLPLMCGQTLPIDHARLTADIVNSARETLGRYGCGSTSTEVENVCISQNLWRDVAGRYLMARLPSYADYYWDLQTMSNTHAQSLGFTDTYINDCHVFSPAGITCMGWFWAFPRLVIDRLTPGPTPKLSVEPDPYYPQRWPLLPLADWKAGKIPVCVVDARGRVAIEGEIDPIVVRCPVAK